jgi:carbonic anhydrase
MARKAKSVTGEKSTAGGTTGPIPDPNVVEFTYYYHRKGEAAPATAGLAVTDRHRPMTAAAAAERLWKRNGRFAEFIAHCQEPPVKPGSGQVNPVRIPLVKREVGLERKPSGFPEQEPFAAILGCVDARAPVELLFTQGFDDLYIVRVAGNPVGPDCAGSLHYALHSFAALAGTKPADLPKKTLRLIVVLGHSDCGAVTAAVKTFLGLERLPELEGKHLPDGSVGGLLAKLQYPAVAIAAELLPEGSLGPGESPEEIRLAALIDVAVYLNAAWSAHELVALVQQYDYAGQDREVEVRYGVFDPRDCFVRAGSANYLFAQPGHPASAPGRVEDALAPPPADLRALRRLGEELVAKIKGHGASESGMTALAEHYRIARSKVGRTPGIAAFGSR